MPQNDEFGRHEILHMSSFLMRAVDMELLEHEQIKNNTQWKELAEKAHQALFDLYQSIGQVSLEGED